MEAGTGLMSDWHWSMAKHKKIEVEEIEENVDGEEAKRESDRAISWNKCRLAFYCWQHHEGVDDTGKDIGGEENDQARVTQTSKHTFLPLF